ncbi:MAG: tRNA (adenosine(37)-N6)-dimethylallyltransferase MiaA [Propionibacteriaceae bacterium]|jgi:tRNA dimethylallyltransferase|nr:tRNA (adenosine(37)-N6)-dimethylallyltransferase MiaA [Propionibacteriaceae bacterium]
MIVSLIGPTAAGKTEQALQLAEALAGRGQPAEIVNADSMLVYRGMDIGTAKPSLAERARVPHHLIDILDVTETASVAEFQTLARAAIQDCQARGVIPLLVGGSALYVRAILDRFEFPGTDPAIRAKYEAQLAELGAAALHQRLTAIAPHVAKDILPQNGRRIVRALEVIELTGDFRPVIGEPEYFFDGVVQLGLALERPEMDRRIAARVERMWEQGFVAEVEQLLQAGLREGKTAPYAIGYHQIISYLDGQCSAQKAREDTVVRTRQFSRKQLSWFRRDTRIQWFDAVSLGGASHLLAALEAEQS